MSEARQRWLDEGVRVLAEQGVSGIRIDRIAARLNLSKGSFHHHFDGAVAYRKQLLNDVERRLLSGVERAVELAPELGAPGTFAYLTSLLDASRGGELSALAASLRAWANNDEAAAHAQQRVDAATIAALQAIWSTLGVDDAYHAALLPYLIAVGASVVVPPVSAEDLRSVFELLLPLVPGTDMVAPDEPQQPG